jgi:predicted nucleic acid-binding protein
LIVVADTSPVLHLGRIGRLDLIPAVVGRVVVPRTVWGELVHPGTNDDVLRAIQSAPWIELAEDPQLEDLKLDPGETAAILLAEALPADALLIDERRGRAVARSRGIAVIGTLGIVAGARRSGVIESAAPIIAELRADGSWLADSLVEALLRELDEGR